MPISVILGVQQLALVKFAASVVPVKVQHQESNKEIITFAMLDTCSQGTFATENLKNQLNIDDIQTSIGTRTPIRHQKQSSDLLDGLSLSKLVLAPGE